MQQKQKFMERFILQDLIAWKNRSDRKPLILLEARQIGKTYILKEFGRREFENVANNPTLVGLRFSMSDYREQDRLTNVPLYGINAYLETKKDI